MTWMKDSNTHVNSDKSGRMEWIDRDMLTPDSDFEVIACCDDDVEMCIYREHEAGSYFEKADRTEFKATHWMSKPDPYQPA